MKIVWYQKILSILIVGLLFFVHPVFLGNQYENCSPFTEGTTEKKSSEESKFEDSFDDKEKSKITLVHTIKTLSKNYAAIAFNSPIGFHSHRLFTHSNQTPRHPTRYYL